jgi:exopolysaccharide biosynthesis WecB/TagA/CpsF family protein
VTAPPESGRAEALPHRWFLGVRFTPLDVLQAAALIAARPPDAPFAFVVTPNAQHVVAADRGDRRFIEAQQRAWLVLNDSRVLRLLSRRLFGADFPIAPGSDLSAELFRAGVRPEDPITIIGGGEELERRLRERFGVTRIARLTPPMGFYRDPQAIDRCAAFVRDNPARYVFLVVGAPQSEMVALRIVEMGGAVGLGLCVGSALNFVTGIVRRSPGWLRRANLEWLYRLAQNPVGHARRVFVDSPPILWIALRARLEPQARRSSGRAA